MMEKRAAVKFFVRFLLLTIATFLVISLSFILKSSSGVGPIIGTVLAITNVLLLLYYTVIASIELFNHLRNKDKEYFDAMYIVNVVFAFLITGVFTTFYIVVIIS